MLSTQLTNFFLNFDITSSQIGSGRIKPSRFYDTLVIVIESCLYRHLNQIAFYIYSTKGPGLKRAKEGGGSGRGDADRRTVPTPGPPALQAAVASADGTAGRPTGVPPILVLSIVVALASAPRPRLLLLLLHWDSLRWARVREQISEALVKG